LNFDVVELCQALNAFKRVKIQEDKVNEKALVEQRRILGVVAQ